ncbi:3-keto-5-aminohexanoate cleavage protein [Saccharopolyspora sp. HNM0983]|uniref:3-keto-5-aminohexanoate cleavage protein n=1 Tax=Saccharopolyspora montiporae TaxID=2781240 RepID=A0A929FYJ8_9PSEU|nr:3-keto-5-aminohexanoate cleavage protein [Saccharopolyspora sp. HNM0983]MBE9373550.1 3-keto-5-aminohexanoate cleavage protein [Saccharopolyspora sp. HNM0983]
MLQACLNGARTPREHHHLPTSPADLAAAAADAVAAGATDLHLHPKTPDGADSLEPHLVAATLRAVRAAAPTTPIGITTGAWTTPDPHTLLRSIRAWTVLPDHASVNWHEPAADDIATALHRRGIGIEAGIHSGTGAETRLRTSPLRHHLLRVLAEVNDPTTRAATTAAGLLDRLHPAPAPVLLHGTAAGAWHVLDLAVDRGLDTRIGLEDTLLLPDGTIATDNAELIRTAARRLDRSELP